MHDLKTGLPLYTGLPRYTPRHSTVKTRQPFMPLWMAELILM